MLTQLISLMPIDKYKITTVLKDYLWIRAFPGQILWTKLKWLSFLIKFEYIYQFYNLYKLQKLYIIFIFILLISSVHFFRFGWNQQPNWTIEISSFFYFRVSVSDRFKSNCFLPVFVGFGPVSILIRFFAQHYYQYLIKL